MSKAPWDLEGDLELMRAENARLRADLSVERARCAEIARSLGHEQCALAIEMGAIVEDVVPTKRV